MSEHSLLCVESLVKSLGGKAVLHNVSLQLQAGEILGIAGESGCGKSTLARCIMGLHDKDAGAVYFRARRLPACYKRQDFIEQAGNIQMIFQDPQSSLNPRLTIGDILCEPLRLAGKKTQLSKNDQCDMAAQWLLRMGLQADDLSRYPHSFSGGQLQRIGIARALISQPALLICDEPISALDVSVQAQIINLLKDLRDELGLSLLFIGHDLAMMRYLCDRVAVMQAGVIVEEGSAMAVLDDPQHVYTRKLVHASPVSL
jgi:ABC-type dipeptide/oligopeptide/nickel transport system ATPase subunit